MKASLQEPFSSYIIRKLGTDETVKSFDCGDADLNDFILNEAGPYREALLAVTYVFETVDDEEHERIAAYFSLANDRVSMSDFPNKTEFMTVFPCRIFRIKLNSIVFASIVLSMRNG